jgi:transcriptional regulator with XRE-family HTH domain
MSSGSGDASLSFAAKLNHLFATVRPAHGGEATYREVAAAIAEQGGPTISPSYIYQLRSGIRQNPTLRHVQALAKYFGVEVPTSPTRRSLSRRTPARDARGHAGRPRAVHRSPRREPLRESLELVSDMIDLASKMEVNRREARKSVRGGSRTPGGATGPVTPTAEASRLQARLSRSRGSAG